MGPTEDKKSAPHECTAGSIVHTTAYEQKKIEKPYIPRGQEPGTFLKVLSPPPTPQKTEDAVWDDLPADAMAPGEDAHEVKQQAHL